MPLIHPLLAGTALVPDSLLRDENETVEPHVLAALTRSLGAATGIWTAILRHDPVNRWYTRLVLSGSVEVWLISWCPDQYTRAHDHGGAFGALTVIQGPVTEIACDADWRPRDWRQHERGASLTFDRNHIHKVGNSGTIPAATIHAYSPPELPMRYAPDAAEQAVEGFLLENALGGAAAGDAAGALAVGGGRP
ncbi:MULTISPECIES: cysteine dioxygenase family protein [Protofrankia]|uniref:cysteine dioxygenase n=1 Tax=Protofrankia TaxID=2994361 RepID=UPI00069AA7B0|nr:MULTISPECIES: cysteine dioxygenase family protein [Protofrankia]ONH34677.1 hypothetical protein BL254_14695 [Protofrankia sp. BMG5.30]